MENHESVLAVDLGRSRCRAALWDGAGRRTAEGAGAPGLASSGGADAALAAILAVARPLLDGAGVTTVSAGAAGVLSAPAAAAALADRDRRMAAFPEDFAWIHGHDAMMTARRARPDGTALAAA